MDISAPRFLRVEQTGTTSTIWLNKPEKGNALCLPLVEEMIAAIGNAQSSRLIVFRGEGKHFCSGLDLSNMDEESDSTLLHRFVRIEELRSMIENCPIPTVAIGTGASFGAGADIFAACDYRLAVAGARFAFPGVAFGMVLGTARLAALVGNGVARDILHARRVLNADEAKSVGLVTEIIEADAIASRLAEIETISTNLEYSVSVSLRRVTATNRADSDLAELVRSASRPGLKARIEAYRASLAR